MQALRAAQGAVTEAREARARTEARLEGARTRRQDVARQIRDALGVAPEGCLAVAEIEPGAELPPLADVERKLTGLKADRERLGGVNLQADDELQTLGAQVTGLDAERADVEQAIAKLRAAIGQLNREAHKRLAEAFEAVDTHFRKLFTTLFGGGEARLEMIEGEDPLEGGLEIIAKPPGKKPATLSLLVGRRAVADRAVAHLRGVPDQSLADLRARRGGRAARRRQRRPLLPSARGHGGAIPPPASWSSPITR